jgi:hypothetical protein
MHASELLRRLKRRLADNSPGLTVAVLAMLVALTGGAFAASGALTGKQKKEVEKIAKKFAGKPGPQGPAGATGATGTKGDKGDPGSAGLKGEAGKSVKVTPISPGSEFECESNGGAMVEEEGKPSSAEEICNGKAGSPWTVGGVLPPGEQENGSWAFAGSTSDTNGIRVPISFTIPLPGKLEPGEVHFKEDADFETFCEGTVAAPKAKPGQLCVYFPEFVENTTFQGIYPTQLVFPEETGASRSGAMLVFSAPTGAAAGYGTFAVRASAAP